MKTKKGKSAKKILVLLMLIVLLLGFSRIIYAATTEKTAIVCSDENMFNALKSELSQYILLPTDVNKATLTINIPVDSIPQITQINLEDKQISDITGIEKLTNLSIINLGKNRITNIQPLQNLSSITELKLNDNSNLGENVSTVLSNKTTINKLNLSSTGLTDITFVSNLTALQELEIANDSFNNLNAIERITTIKKLDVSGNQSIRTIESVLKLSNLEKLNLSNTGIDTLELDSEHLIGIYNLRNLKELYLSGIDVDSVSPVVRTYYNETHHKNENGDWEGQDVALLLNLEKLDISNINITEESYVSMPSFSELSYLENLSSLDMQGNNIDSVYEIYLLHNLKEVNLRHNKIEDLSRFSKYKY